VTSGRITETSLVARVFDWMNRVTLRGARDVIVLDRFMCRRMMRKLNVPEKTAIVPPWSHDVVRDNVPHEDNPFRAFHQFGDRLVVMYSGNHGYSTPLDTLLEAAKVLEGERELLFVFIGGGVIKRRIDEMVARDAPPNIVTLPYQPLADIRYSLSSADVHVVSLANEGTGVVHPCKIYGALAIGRPILALAPRDSYLADILDEHRVGWRVEHGDVAGLTAILRDLLRMPRADLRALGDGARAAARTVFVRERLLARVCDIIESDGGAWSEEDRT